MIYFKVMVIITNHLLKMIILMKVTTKVGRVLLSINSITTTQFILHKILILVIKAKWTIHLTIMWKNVSVFKKTGIMKAWRNLKKRFRIISNHLQQKELMVDIYMKHQHIIIKKPNENLVVTVGARTNECISVRNATAF